jgi:phosphatidylglycerol---prolipoprotein diacylglyceryl transferase
MIPFPNISPNVFEIPILGFTFALRWYALAYIAGILIAWWLALRTIRRAALWPGSPPLTAEQLERLMTWMILGIILGGRLGYVIFYEPGKFLADPASALRVWEGGMAFHGGFMGVVVAAIIFCRREGIPMLPLGDLAGMAARPICHGAWPSRVTRRRPARAWPAFARATPASFMKRRWKGCCCSS